MSDVTVTVAGFVGTTPKLFGSESGNDFTSFRVAHTKRYMDRSGQWADGRTTWFTVKAWRGFARNITTSVRKGDPVVVTGRLAVEEWSGPDGIRTNLVIEATALGPDLTRGEASFRHTVYRRENDAAAESGQAASADGVERLGAGDLAGRDPQFAGATGVDDDTMDDDTVDDDTLTNSEAMAFA